MFTLILLPVAVVVVLIRGRKRHPIDLKELGAVSPGWLTNANSYDRKGY